MVTIKCEDCGKFISHQDILDRKAISETIPDTKFTIEQHKFWCESCVRKKNMSNVR